MAKQTPNKQVRIDEDVYEACKVVADEMRLSTTWLINDILRKAMVAVHVAESDDKDRELRNKDITDILKSNSNLNR